MLASTRLTEDGVEGVLANPSGLAAWHLAIGLDAAFQGTELPAATADLDRSLASVDGDALRMVAASRPLSRWRRTAGGGVVASYRATLKQSCTRTGQCKIFNLNSLNRPEGTRRSSSLTLSFFMFEN